MTQHALVRFAQGSDADFIFLKSQIDKSAREGRSYAFQNCLLLPDCTPACATVGFSAEGGGYLIYVSPTIIYRGPNLSALRLFLSGRLSFPTFDALRDFLRGIGVQPRPNAPISATSPAPAAMPRPRADTLTEPDKVRFPRSLPQRAPGYQELAAALGAQVLGQEQAIEAVSFCLYTHIHKKSPARPLSLIFHGPTGVGKSELGKQVAPVLNQFCGKDAYQFVWTELNTFTEPHSVYRLTGAPPGYVGYEDKPIFEAVANNPRTVFMFDELEKAHPEVLKTFMSVLDEGRCAARKEQAGHSRELDFRQCVFLFTTNTNLSGPRRLPALGFAPSADLPKAPPTPPEQPLALSDQIFHANEKARRALLQSGCLKEIAGRFSGFVEFKALSDLAKIRIIAKQIAALGAEYGLRLTYISPELVQAAVDCTGDSEVFSVRSHTGIIEGLFTGFFVEQAERFHGQDVRLEGGPGNKRLVPEPERARA